jgi:hypothetical protein
MYYRFYIKFKGREYLVGYAPSIKQMTLEYKGILSDDDYWSLRKYLRLEGFLDKGTNYTIL